MSRTFRKDGHTGKKVKDKDTSKFCHHDITPILKGIKQSQKAKEKNYFIKNEDTLYDQPPKSRGRSW